MVVCDAVCMLSVQDILRSTRLNQVDAYIVVGIVFRLVSLWYCLNSQDWRGHAPNKNDNQVEKELNV